MKLSSGRLLTVAAAFAAGAITASAFGTYLLVAHPGFVSRVENKLAQRLGSQSNGVPAQPTPEALLDGVVVHVDTLATTSPINPLIYGVAFADQAYLKELGATSNRWGGNATSTFNWDLGNADNAGRDWEFRNQGSNPADSFISQSLAAGAQPVMTVPTIGWVAKNRDNGTMAIGVPSQGGPPVSPGSQAIAGYDPAANRARTSVPSLPNSIGPLAAGPNPSATVVYQDAWVHYLASKFGTGPKGVTYFEMDNEPDLWWITHTDVCPVETGYDNMVKVFTSYADAVKKVEPSTKILGPVVSGWTAYQFSALDRGSDNFATHADRQAHGDVPFLKWWLQQIAQHDQALGKRTLDYLDVHYYPQAQNVALNNAADPDTQARRIRSVRSLYDPTYGDESWIAQPVDLIPMLKAWIAKSYPGTGIAITEYNFGGEKDASGAVALAEVLGIFGREGVSMANYWAYPPPNSPSSAAFRLYRNYDGHGATFGDLSLPVTSGRRQVAAFASRHSDTGEVDLVLANESLTQTATVQLQLAGAGSYKAQQFVIMPGSSDIASEAIASIGAPISLEPLSVRLLRLRKQ